MTDLFLTGATGFLGTRILARLDPADYGSVTLLCRREPDLPERLRNAANVRVVIAALDATGDYADRLGPDTVIVHLAAVTGKASREDYFRVNTQATAALVGAAKQAGVAGFLFASSIAVSFADRRGYHYADSKEQAETLLRDSRLPVCILRPTIILGDDSPIWKSFHALAKKSLVVLPGNGRTRIQPIDVDDLVDIVIDIVTRRRFDGEVLEVGGPDTLTMDAFVQKIHAAAIGGKARIVHLPLGVLLPPLRLVESVLPALLPVSAGQFASFHNDGVVAANAPVSPSGSQPRGIDDMVRALAGQGANG